MHQTYRGLEDRDSHTENQGTAATEAGEEVVEEEDHQEQQDPEGTQTTKAMVQS